MNVLVRPVLPADLDVLGEVLENVYRADGYPVEGVSDPQSWLNPDRLIAQWTATIDDEPVGHVALCRPVEADGAPKLLLEHGVPPEHLGVLSRLFVSPKFRGKGVARQLVAKVAATTKALDIRATLDVLEKDESAVGLYRSMGWYELGRFQHEVEGGSTFEAIGFMEPMESDGRFRLSGSLVGVEFSPPWETPAPPPDARLVDRIIGSLRQLSDRQSELIRLARGVDERSSEVDDAAKRAREFIEERLDDQLDDDGLARLVELLQEQITSRAHGRSSPSDQKRVLATALEEVLSDLPDGHSGEYLRATVRALSVPKSGHFLHNSLLVLMAGELEMFVNKVARACFECRPDSLSGEQSLRWHEVSAHESMDAIRDSLVDRTIEDLMRGPLIEWMDFFKKTFGISEIKAAKRYGVQEALQRRHCIVHNVGRASSLYTKKLESFSEHNIETGSSLEVDSHYLRSAADSMLEIAYSLVWAVGDKLCIDDAVRELLFRELGDIIYDLLQRRRFDLVIQVTSEAPIHRLPEGTGLIMKVNRWVAYKEMDRLASVKKEIEAFDTSTRSREFQLAKFALLDMHPEALKLVESMLDSGDLSRAHYLAWPLLRGVRSHERELGEGNAVAKSAQSD